MTLDRSRSWLFAAASSSRIRDFGTQTLMSAVSGEFVGGVLVCCFFICRG